MTDPSSASHRIHLFGASGSGTSTLGAALAQAIGGKHLDSDRYYWLLTDPPFTTTRPIPERLRLIDNDCKETSNWTLSGSLCSWGEPLLASFSLAIFLYLDPGLRMLRLRERELARYGVRIQPGGDMYEQHQAFMEWAAGYDTARAPIRSLELHEHWMTTLPCPVIRLDAAVPTKELTGTVLMHLRSSGAQ